MSTPRSGDRTFHMIEAVPVAERLEGAPVRLHRRWSDELKEQVVAESFLPGANVSAIARRVGIDPSQLFSWRKALRKGGVRMAASQPDALTEDKASSRLVNLSRDRRRSVQALARRASTYLRQVQTGGGNPLRHLTAGDARTLPHRWPRRDRLQHCGARHPAANNYAKELALRGQRRRWTNVGNHSDIAADDKNERCRSARMAHANARASRQRLAQRRDRCSPALALRSLNGNG